MLAWLASLHNPAQAASGSEAVAAEAASGAGASAIAQGGDGKLPSGRHAGAESLTLQALQRGGAALGQGGEPGAGAGGDTDHGRGAMGLDGMSLVKAGETFGDATGAASFASALQREMGAAGAARTEATPRHYTGNLHTPMDSPAFTQALSDRVAFWVNGPAAEGPMTAELRLNPAEMGPVHIRIELDGQNAQIDFAATAAETRQAIEASLGQLSAALEESGLKLSGGGVSDQTPQQQAWEQAAAGQSDDNGQQGRGRGQPSNASGRWAQVGTPEGMSENLGVRAGRPGRAGGLDLYA
jgi:flagellar hook-length control protein FliK